MTATVATSEARTAATHSLCKEWLVAIGIALACAAVFANALPNAFALDDQFRVVNNPGIQRFWPPWRHFAEPRTMSTLDRITQYRPLLPLTLSANYAVSGDSAVGYHLGNLGLQIVASLLGFFLCVELLRHWSPVPLAQLVVLVIAGFSALLFAVHPVSGVAVNYISARDLLLMQVFFLGMLLDYARMRRLGETASRWAVVIVLLALSLLAKTNLVVAPLIFLAFDLILARSALSDRGMWRRAGVAAAIVAAFFLLTRLALGFSDLSQVTQADASPLQYGLTQARLHVFHYLLHFVWPFSIRLLPYIEPGRVTDYRVWLGALFVLATIVLAWRYRRTAPIVAFGIIIYWILMIPESSILPLYQAAVDYRPYAGSLFLFLAVIALLVTSCGGVYGAALALAVFSLYIGAASIVSNAHWRTGERLWSHSVAYGGDAVAHLNLAMSIADRHDPRVRAEFEESLRLEPNYALAHIDLCVLQLELGETAAGLERCEYAARIAPSWPQSHYWLAFAYRRLGRPREAAAASARAAEIDPDNLRYPYEAARDALAVQDWGASLRLAELVRQRDPDYQEIAFIHGVALQMLGRPQEAIDEYVGFLRTHPEHAPATLNTGYALASLGRCSEAIPYFERTLALRPGDAAAQRQLSRCRAAPRG